MKKELDAKQWLNLAIKRHELHMAGKEPTTGKDGEISQMLMMNEMKAAYKVIDGGTTTANDFYYENSKMKM